MLMPKATVYEDNLLVPRKDDVGTARQTPLVETEPEPQSVDKRSHGLLRSGIPAPDS